MVMVKIVLTMTMGKISTYAWSWSKIFDHDHGENLNVSWLGTDRISGKVRFRPDIRLHFPVPVPVRQRKILPDFCRKMFAFLRTCFNKKYDLF